MPLLRRSSSSSSSNTSSPPVRSSPSGGITSRRHGGLLVVTLNRASALNALNLEMVRDLRSLCSEWERDGSIRAILLRGAGEKAFCAGGDVKSLVTSRDAAAQDAFFREEYALDYALWASSLRKPHVCLWQGAVMGGGVGLSAGATFRVVNERSVLAMPEVAIGLFPDVGGSYFLSRLPKHMGSYLALTGSRMKGADIVHAGLATTFAPSTSFEAIERDLGVAFEASSASPSSASASASSLHSAACATIRSTLARHLAPLPAFKLSNETAGVILPSCFSKGSIEEILSALSAAAGKGNLAAAEAHIAMQKASPTSLKLTLEQLRRGAALPLDACFRQEFRMVKRCMQGRDFYEGVRAVLVDRDNAPRWSPAELSGVADADVKAYFAPLPAQEELVLPPMGGGE